MKRKLLLTATTLFLVISVFGAALASDIYEPQYPCSPPDEKVADVNEEFCSVGKPGETLAIGIYYFGDGAKVEIGHIDPSE